MDHHYNNSFLSIAGSNVPGLMIKAFPNPTAIWQLTRTIYIDGRTPIDLS
jgi:hypothetical protein